MKTILKTLALAGAAVCMAGAAQAGCISFGSNGMYTTLTNVCRYDIIVRYKGDSQRFWNLSDRIRVGRTYVSNASARDEVRAYTCDADDYSRNRCSFN